MSNRLKTMPIRFTVSPDKLTPGEYNYQATVLDPNWQKVEFWVVARHDRSVSGF